MARVFGGGDPSELPVAGGTPFSLARVAGSSAIARTEGHAGGGGLPAGGGGGGGYNAASAAYSAHLGTLVGLVLEQAQGGGVVPAAAHVDALAPHLSPPRASLPPDAAQARREFATVLEAHGVLRSNLELGDLHDPNAVLLLQGFAVCEDEDGFVPPMLGTSGVTFASSMRPASVTLAALAEGGWPVVRADVYIEGVLHWNYCNGDGFSREQHDAMAQMASLVWRCRFSVVVAQGALAINALRKAAPHDRVDFGGAAGRGVDHRAYAAGGSVVLTTMHPQNAIAGWAGGKAAAAVAESFDAVVGLIRAARGDPPTSVSVASLVASDSAGMVEGQTDIERFSILRNLEFERGVPTLLSAVPLKVREVCVAAGFRTDVDVASWVSHGDQRGGKRAKTGVPSPLAIYLSLSGVEGGERCSGGAGRRRAQSHRRSLARHTRAPSSLLCSPPRRHRDAREALGAGAAGRRVGAVRGRRRQGALQRVAGREG